MESFVRLQPALYLFMFVGRIVVADQIDFLVCIYSLIDHAQELEPLLMTVLLLA
jgi:hypothetical protein